MQFDPTIRLDFLVTGVGVLFFVARLQSQVSSNSRDISRTGALLDGLEKRVRGTERSIDRHLGDAERGVDG